MFSKIIRIILFAVIALFIGYHIYSYFNAKNTGDIAPEIVAQLIDGSNFDLNDKKGKYILVSFWGSWCAPCLRDAPNLVRLNNKYKDQSFYDANGFEMLSIAIEKNDKRTRALINKLGFNWKNHIIQESAFVLKAPLALKYNVTDLPTKVLIGPDGRIVKNKLSLAEVDEYLSKKLK